MNRITVAPLAGRLLVLGAVLACAPPERDAGSPRPLVSRRDSTLDSTARARGAAWRALNYPAANLHGPFARPLLADTAADPNDPLTYYRLGDSVRRTLPGLADRAYYWAARLDPTFADAYFARWTLLRREFLRREMPDGSIRQIFLVQPNAVAMTDSLLAHALAYSPFLEGTLDVPYGVRNMSEWRASRDPLMAGMRAYGRREFRKAATEWAKALRDQPTLSILHITRAYAWVRLNEPDSAIDDLAQFARRMETLALDSTVAPYSSKEFVYYAIGMLHASRQRYPEARAAFEQSLLENLGFYMAHLRLSGTLMMLQDTTGALNELETAILIRPDDPLVLEYEGSVLVGAGRVVEGERRLRAALSADSDYALPHVFLGLAAEARNDTTKAKTEYSEYLARAPRTAAERAWARSRLWNLDPRDR